MIFKAEGNFRVEVFSYGTLWYQNGKFHREGGPAFIYAYGDRHWFQNGKCHREDGPAIENADGEKYFYLEGNLYDEKTYWGKIKNEAM